FDLRQAPLFRTGIIKLAEGTGETGEPEGSKGQYILLVDTHHIVSDGTSDTLLTDDFFALYNNRRLKPLQLHYKDYTIWQNHLIASGEVKSQEAYWLEIYKGELPRLDLFTDYKRPEVFTFAGAIHEMELQSEEAAGFKALSTAGGGTLYMNLMAALNTLFFKYTGQADIIIGSGVAGRSHAELQNIVGMFVNTLAMRNYPQG
ncbi:MAG: hypothetical protein GY765_03675, partial [bacterium]|nr:hypothetical protein [bacterium]